MTDRTAHTAGELHVQGVPVGEIAERFGTPFYLYDGDELARRIDELTGLLHPDLGILFSLKANPNVSVCALLRSRGAGAEVSSMAELVTAHRAGVVPEDIVFLGPGKSEAELRACLDGAASTIICESFEELALIDRLAADAGRPATVALRVNPTFSIKGSGLTMGGKPRQFGIDEAQLLAAPDLAARHPHVDLVGVQVYMGTRILSEDTIVENTGRILELAERVAAALDVELRFVDVGGGLGVAYFEGESDLDPATLAAGINPLVDRFRGRHPSTRVLMELGRYLTATAGTYVCRVRYTKESMGTRFAVTDGGTNHHMAAVGIGSFVKRNFPIGVLNRLDEPATGEWNVTGPLCTPNDTVATKAALPDLVPGDLVGVGRSGAYGPSASPGLFLSHGFPAEVLVTHGRAHLVRARDEVEDLLRPQRLVEPADRAVPVAAAP